MQDISHHILLKLAVLILVVVALGLPINNLYVFGLLSLSVLLALTGAITLRGSRWAGAMALAAAVFAIHVLWPAPRIEEGHNVFLIDGPGSALELGLPRDAYRVMAERFDAAYPPERRCRSGEFQCWRPAGIPTRAFAFSADGIFDGHAFSRRVSGIDFQNAVWLRLGIVNDLTLDLVGKDGDVERVQRDRRSLAIFGRWRVKLPFFVMYQFPAAFAGSDLCWRGEVLWEGASEQFERIDHKDLACRTLQSADIGRRIFGVSIGPDAKLAMSLDANGGVQLHRLLDAAATAIGAIGVLMLLVRWRPRRAIVPFAFAAATLLLIVPIDVTFIGGYRPFDGGDDGLIFSGFARDMLQHLVAGDIAGALRGSETVFYFNPGMRYFRALEFLFFGDSFLLYLLLVLAMPLIVYAVALRFLGDDWGLGFALIFMLIPVGALFGTTYAHYLVWAARGYADTLGALAFFSGLLLIAGKPGEIFENRAPPNFWGALLMAVAVMIRPNLAPAVAVLLGAVGLAALWRRQIGKLAAMCLGFSAILLTAWHNWYFGGVFVPLSANAAAPNVLMMTPRGYLDALSELARFDFAGANIGRATSQVIDLLSGPSGLRAAVPLHLFAYAVVIRVICASRFEPMLRLQALAVIALTPVGLIYLVSVRYNLVMWFLMALVVVVWVKIEGLALIERRWPGASDRLARSAAVTHFARAAARLKAAGELGGAHRQPT